MAVRYSANYSRRSRQVSSRLARREEKKLIKQALIFVILAILVIVVFVFVIVPSSVNIFFNLVSAPLEVVETTLPPQVISAFSPWTPILTSRGSSKFLPLLPGPIQPRLSPFTVEIPLKLSKHGEYPCHHFSGRCREVKVISETHEYDALLNELIHLED